MINRVLIRIKVVQLLYSTLLTETRFMLELPPSNPTREKRFAYRLYLTSLELILKIADWIKENNKKGNLIFDTRFIKKLQNSEELFSESEKDHSDILKFTGIIPSLGEKITSSLIFKDFVKKYPDENDKLWEDIFNHIIVVDPDYLTAIGGMADYSLGGVERMKELMKNTFMNFYVTRDNIEDNLKILEQSMAKARELYLKLMLLPLDLTYLREQQLDENRHKFITSSEDLNPNTRFIDNKLIKRLKEDNEIQVNLEKYSWLKEDRDLVNLLLKEIMKSPIYARYMEADRTNLVEDIEFWREIFKNIIFVSENFLDALETSSVFWNDDLDIIGTFVLKSLKKFENDDEREKLLPMYKNEKDAVFGSELFSYVIKNKDYYQSLINEAIRKDKWDMGRLAVMDVVIIMTAIAEIINYPEIPLAATYNEYIEIAKSYSTNKSGSFINGFLRSIVLKLREQGKIFK